MEKRESGSCNNAIKHGAFVQDLILPDENLEDFEHLHQGLIEEWNTIGAAEEETVLTFAHCPWVKRRVKRFHNQEMALAQKSPREMEGDEIRRIASMLNNTECDASALAIVSRLRETYTNWIARTYPRSQYKDAHSYIQALISNAMPAIMRDNEMDATIERESLTFQIWKAARVRELMEGNIKLDERIDSRVDRIIKRLAQVKAFKQIISEQSSQAKSIEHHATSDPRQ